MTNKLERIGVVVVDVQGDFTKFEEGSLAVEGTDGKYVETVEKNTQKLKATGLPIFATQDWHPPSHISFFTNHPGKKPFDVIKRRGKDQVLWPPHCVQNTPGAEILLDRKLLDASVKKGMNPQSDSYSGFQDDGGVETDLEKFLKQERIGKLIVYGIATDYCVKATALDGAALGYRVVLIRNLCRGVALETSQKAIEEMKAKGVVVLEDLNMEKIKEA
jgi:nicotinamidase/pyrazinamidase